MTAVVQCDEAERDYDKQDGFFMNVPAEEEGGVGAECGCCDEVGPRWAEEELDQGGLDMEVSVSRMCKEILRRGLRSERRESR